MLIKLIRSFFNLFISRINIPKVRKQQFRDRFNILMKEAIAAGAEGMVRGARDR